MTKLDPQSNPPSEQPSKSNPVPIAVAIIVALLLVGACWFAFSGGKSGEAASSGPPPFTDPASVPELKIKAEPPDGTTSWIGIDVSKQPKYPAGDPRVNLLVDHGRELFSQACAGCHGLEGKGDGPVPKRFDFVSLPADLTKPTESIKIRSTMMETVPLDSDLFRTLTRGLPSTAMWSYRALPEDDRWALVAYVKTLSPAYSNQSEPEKIPKKLEDSDDLRMTGKNLFNMVCLNCHGIEGMGPLVPMSDHNSGKPFPGIPWARKGGTEMLGGAADEDFARTLITGFHRRSPMLSWKNYLYGSSDPSPAQSSEGDRKLWGLVFYCRELMKRTK